MSDQTPDFSPLTTEQLAALSEAHKQIFLGLGAKDRQFYAASFSPESLGKALDRKGALIQSRARLNAFNQKVKQDMLSAASQTAPEPTLTGGEIAIGAAGLAGVVGIGALASQIAPQGKATWRGVEPGDLVVPLVNSFARQENTDIRFEPPTDEGNQQGIILLRTPRGLVPGLTILLTPLQGATQVQISKLSSEGILEMLKEGGLKLIDLVQYGLRRKRSNPAGWLDMAGRAIEEGVDIAQMVNDLDLEDKAWEVIKNAADPLQAIYDEMMVIKKEQRLKLEAIWDDYYSCPKCRVEFGAEDTECRVCGSERPAMPDQPDPRLATS
jgi:hypothetical protein